MHQKDRQMDATQDGPDRSGIFAGDDPFAIAKAWLAEAESSETNDPNAIALATVDTTGMPNVRMVLLKEIEDNAFVFYTNYTSKKAQEVEQAGKAAFVLHWKSLRRQIRVRGTVVREDGPQADAYYASRSLKSRLGAKRPPFWGGFRIDPVEIEFWADGPFRLHDRFRWTRESAPQRWVISRLNP
jgi:pyridoxamine 5'-phosphate oxidase